MLVDDNVDERNIVRTKDGVHPVELGIIKVLVDFLLRQGDVVLTQVGIWYDTAINTRNTNNAWRSLPS